MTNPHPVASLTRQPAPAPKRCLTISKKDDARFGRHLLLMTDYLSLFTGQIISNSFNFSSGTTPFFQPRFS